MMEQCWQRMGLSIVIGLMTLGCQGQTFSLMQKSDSLYLLTLTTDSTSYQWPLPYPVYRMETGDVDGSKLQDFYFINGRIRSLETNIKEQYTVAEYRWDDFGMAFVRYLIKDGEKAEAMEKFKPKR